MMVANQVIPYEATAEGRSARIAKDGGEHMHSYEVSAGQPWSWRSVDWNLHNETCKTMRCWRRKTLRERNQDQ